MILCFMQLILIDNFTFSDAGEVIITKFVVPPHVAVEDDVVLECDHNVPDDRLLHVQWHFNNREFFR